MAWKECDRMSERKKFVLLTSVEGANISQLCLRFGIARRQATNGCSDSRHE